MVMDLELASIRPGIGNGRPLIPHMLIFADDLAILAAVAFREVNNKRLRLFLLFTD
jgi:hypothetical protein